MTPVSGAPARTSLIISTYNWVEALAATLASVRSQWELPDEVLVADDGSRAETRDVVTHEARTFPTPLRHIWHDDTGFRLGAIRNRAMAAATGAYLIQVDGDLLLHPGFVRAHRRFAQRGSYVQGSRAMLDAERTRYHLEPASGRRALPGPLTRGVRNRANGIYAPALEGLVRGPRDPLTRTRGANMAFWRDDIVLVNGYDEGIEGWGREDSELAARLQNAGIRRRNLKFSAVAWHLHHVERSGDTVQRNHLVFERTVREGRVRCERGIDQYLPSRDNLPGPAADVRTHIRAGQQ